MAISSFKDLEVWQVAHQVVLTVYKLTQDFPVDERFGLTQQMRRARQFQFPPTSSKDSSDVASATRFATTTSLKLPSKN